MHDKGSGCVFQSYHLLNFPLPLYPTPQPPTPKVSWDEGGPFVPS